MATLVEPQRPPEVEPLDRRRPESRVLEAGQGAGLGGALGGGLGDAALR